MPVDELAHISIGDPIQSSERSEDSRDITVGGPCCSAVRYKVLETIEMVVYPLSLRSIRHNCSSQLCPVGVDYSFKKMLQG